MKKTLATGWKSIGITGQIFLSCFLFYFITKALKH